MSTQRVDVIMIARRLRITRQAVHNLIKRRQYVTYRDETRPSHPVQISREDYRDILDKRRRKKR